MFKELNKNEMMDVNGGMIYPAPVMPVLIGVAVAKLILKLFK